jgi:hypothetical protein
MLAQSLPSDDPRRRWRQDPKAWTMNESERKFLRYIHKEQRALRLAWILRTAEMCAHYPRHHTDNRVVIHSHVVRQLYCYDATESDATESDCSDSDKEDHYFY